MAASSDASDSRLGDDRLRSQEAVFSAISPTLVGETAGTLRPGFAYGIAVDLYGGVSLYNFFGGIGETTGGLLLTIPRFATLGALVSFAMTLNVLMLNLGYDVAQKNLFHSLGFVLPIFARP